MRCRNPFRLQSNHRKSSHVSSGQDELQEFYFALCRRRQRDFRFKMLFRCFRHSVEVFVAARAIQSAGVIFLIPRGQNQRTLQAGPRPFARACQ